MEKIKNKVKNLKVAEKLKVYRICMITLITVMGIVPLALTVLINSKLNEITEVWSPSLNYIQQLDVLTSNYRLKQYQHLASLDADAMSVCEEEMEDLKQQIIEVAAKFEALIVTEQGRADFAEVDTKWTYYREASEEIIKMSRAGKREEAAVLMLADSYDAYNDFGEKFDELNKYSSSALTQATNVAHTLVFIIFVVILAVAALSAIFAANMGRMISEMFTVPITQIENAVSSMRIGELSNTDMLDYESDDELGEVVTKLNEAMNILSEYILEISTEVKKIADGDLMQDRENITDFLGDFSEIKNSLVYILKRFNGTLTEIQSTSEHVAADAREIENASQSLAEGATEQAAVIEELTATVDTVVSLAENTAKDTQSAAEQIKRATERAAIEKQKMGELTAEMEHITLISKEIENIITDIEDIATQTNLLSLNAAIEAARAGESGRGFAVVADQIGKLATDSAQSAINTRELINKTLVEIEKGNTIALSTSESFNQIIADMDNFAEVAQQTTENANTQAEALAQIGEGIEQLSGAIQNTAASSEENTAISVNLSDKSEQLNDLVNRFELF